MINRSKLMDHKRYIVVNADDFGFSTGVNQAILQAHEDGILTSASLMVTGAAFHEAVGIAGSHPNLGVGLHLVLASGSSALPPSEIPQLVNPAGAFPNDPAQAGLTYQFNPAARLQLRAEIRAQFERFRQTGLPLSHVDGHLHLHCHPVVLSILADLAAEFGIRRIRLPFEELRFEFKITQPTTWNKAVLWSVFGLLRRAGIQILRSPGIQYTERVYGLFQTGKISESYLLSLLPRITVDCVELYAHPAISLPGEPFSGLEGSGELELAALQSQKVRRTLLEYGFELINFFGLEGR